MTDDTEPNLECSCICNSPAFYAPHKTGHACCDKANVIEDNSLLVKTTNVTEPYSTELDIKNKIAEIIGNRIVVVRAPVTGKYIIHGQLEAMQDLTALIANQVREARLDEVTMACKNWEENPTLPATYLIDRIAALKGDDK